MRVRNNFEEGMRDKRIQLGPWSNLTSNYSIDVVAGAGYDWIVIDTVHSPTDLETVLGNLQAIAAYPTAGVVRVPWNDTGTIKRYLDVGLNP